MVWLCAQVLVIAVVLASCLTLETKEQAPTPLTVLVYHEQAPEFAQALNRLYPSPDVKYVQATADNTVPVDARTVAMIMTHQDAAHVDARIPKYRRFGLTFEPRSYSPALEKWRDDVGRFLVSGDASDLRENAKSPFLSHYCFLPFVPVIPKAERNYERWLARPYVMSIMVSEKKDAPGHQYRHSLCEAIVREDLPIHIYGRGSHHYPSHSRGEFNSLELYDDYKFTVAVENFVEHNYFSEKVTNPIARNTVPLYLGANVDEYLGSEFGHRLSGQLDADMALLRQVLKHPEAYYVYLASALKEMQHGKASLSTYLWHTYTNKAHGKH